MNEAELVNDKTCLRVYHMPDWEEMLLKFCHVLYADMTKFHQTHSSDSHVRRFIIEQAAITTSLARLRNFRDSLTTYGIYGGLEFNGHNPLARTDNQGRTYRIGARVKFHFDGDGGYSVDFSECLERNW